MSQLSNADFLKRLTRMFLVEAREHVQALGSGLLLLERAPQREHQAPIVEKLFRSAHSLKGAARTISAREIEGVCQQLESVFSDLKSARFDPTMEVIESMHRAVTRLEGLLGTMQSDRSTNPVVEKPVAAPGLQEETDVAGPVELPPVAPQRASPATQGLVGMGETVRVAAARLDAIFVQTEEMLAAKQTKSDHLAVLKALVEKMVELDRQGDESQRVLQKMRQASGPATTDAGRALADRLQTQLAQNRMHVRTLSTGLTDLANGMNRDLRRFDVESDRLLAEVKQALMLPAETILAGLPKLVHDLALESDRSVEFAMHGIGIELDKRILEQIKDPLVHLVRNSIDHGIEPAAERLALGKSPVGKITLEIIPLAGRVEIKLSDDGAGINGAAIKAAAIKAGGVSVAAADIMSDDEVHALIFGSGVTSSTTVTEISGRGLGMAIVHEQVTRLGGMVSLESRPGAGTATIMNLPLTLATVRGTQVRVANREFIVPTADVQRTLRIPRASIRRVENRDCIFVRDETLALVSLAEVLGVNQPNPNRTPWLTVLILAQGRTHVAFAVDEVLREQEVLAKPLGPLLLRVRNLAGATVLGPHRLLPILNVPDLLQSVTGCLAISSQTAVAAPERSKRVLVVDDSITARTMLQSILEAAGYEVKTAPDGATAFSALQAGSFDLVVSDVEMPRMNGFELTKRIRNESELAHLPVVLVTARETQEDRENGMDAGANAYLVKSGFDQTNLLETLRELI